MRGYVPRLSFGAMLVLLGVATVVGVGTAVVLHRVFLVPVVIGIAIAIGIVYIFLPIGRAPLEAELPPPVDDAPFDDPVEEADRLDSSRSPRDSPAPMDTVTLDPAKDDPSYDPVEEADRIDSSEPPSSGGHDSEQDLAGRDVRSRPDAKP
jgi:hypothetical protein